MNPSHSVSPTLNRAIVVTEPTSQLTQQQLDTFSRWMSSSEPWLHFGYGTEECRGKISMPGMKVLVAKRDDRDIGFLAFSPLGDLGGPHIHYVVVEQSHRSRGTGSKLIKQLLAESGTGSVYLTVSESNVRAKRLYESLGFRQIGSIPDYNKYGEAEFILRYPGRPKREK